MKALIDACQAHLELEERALTEAQGAIQRLRGALRAGDEPTLESCLQQNDNAAATLQTMKARRGALREQMSASLGTPSAQTTIADVIRCAGPQAASALRLKREVVQRLSRQLETMTLSTAALVRQNLDVYQHILFRLTGADPSTASYSSLGKTQTPSCQGPTRARC